jgi:hypothetical protein
MSDFPIGFFLFWKVGRAELRELWTVYGALPGVSLLTILMSID